MPLVIIACVDTLAYRIVCSGKHQISDLSDPAKSFGVIVFAWLKFGGGVIWSFSYMS
jgi:hypothetical protein